MVRITMAYVGDDVERTVDEIVRAIGGQVLSRSYRVSNELTNGAMFVLRGARSGRRYRISGSGAFYTASAPGEPPANRTGAFRASFQPQTVVLEHGERNVLVSSRTRSEHMVGGYNLQGLLEDGTSRMAPRPHAERIVEDALPRAVRIYEQPYVIGR